MIGPPPRSPLFPHTTLFRFWDAGNHSGVRTRASRLHRRRCRDKKGPCSILSCRGIFSGGGETLESVKSEEHTSELQSHFNLLCRLLLVKKNKPLTRLPSLKT